MKAPHPRWVPEPLNPEELPKTSSLPAESPEEQVGLFRDVLEALERRGIPYAVSGAFALRQHTGICRQTKDLDLFVTASNRGAALQCLREEGMGCEVTDPVWLAKARRDKYFVDLITGMSNGLIVVEDSWIERAQPAVVYGVTTRVLARSWSRQKYFWRGVSALMEPISRMSSTGPTAASIGGARWNCWESIGRCCCGLWCSSGMSIPRQATMFLQRSGANC